MTLHMPFDLQYWLVDVLSGSNEIFAGISLLAIAFISAKYQFHYLITMILFALFAGLIFSPIFPGISVIIIAVAGLIGGWIIARVFKT